MANDSQTHYWDPIKKVWFQYNDKGEACIEIDDEKQAHPDILVDELIRQCPNFDVLAAYLKSVPKEKDTEKESLQEPLDDSIISKERLYEICTRRAVKIGLRCAKQYNIDGEDVVQNALLGMCQAIETYNSMGPFIEQLNRSIREAVLCSIPIGEHICCLPWRIKPLLYKLVQKEEADNCHFPEMLMATYHCNHTIADNLASLLIDPMSIDLLVESNDHSLSDNGQGDDCLVEHICKSIVSDVVHQAIESLKSEKEKTVIRKRFGFVGNPMTLEAIGVELGVSRERIRQIEKKALKQLAHPSRRLRPIAETEERKRHHNQTTQDSKKNRKTVYNSRTRMEAERNMQKSPSSYSKNTTPPKQKYKPIKTEMVVHGDFGTRTITFEY